MKSIQYNINSNKIRSLTNLEVEFVCGGDNSNQQINTMEDIDHKLYVTGVTEIATGAVSVVAGCACIGLALWYRHFVFGYMAKHLGPPEEEALIQ